MPGPPGRDGSGQQRQVALVTGAAQGLGHATPIRLAAEGFAVAVNDITDDGRLTELAGRTGWIAVPADISDPAAGPAMAGTVAGRLGPVQVLVANAAAMAMSPFLEAKPDQWWHQIDVNLSGHFRVIQAVIPGMRAQGHGRIIIISSGWGVIGHPNATAYAASKAGLIALTKGLGRELGPQGILTNAIAPSFIDTEQLRVDATDAGITLEEMRQRYREQIPVRQLASPADIAAAVAFLAGPVDGRKVPRFAGSASFARLPEIDRVSDYDVAVLGAPFDSGVSYRPGARFGPMAVRQASRHLRPGHHVELDCSPFAAIQVVDAGDVPVTPFSIDEAVEQIAVAAADLLHGGRKVIAVGGDHTIALPMLRSVVRENGPVALVHFDAHLDTWDTYFNAPTTHGTIFRRAFEEGLLVEDHSIHVGIRGPLYDRGDLEDDRRFGFRTIRASDIDVLGAAGAIAAITERVADLPVYLSIDIDVLDPSFAQIGRAHV